jgi:hypothetical protein
LAQRWIDYAERMERHSALAGDGATSTQNSNEKHEAGSG